MSEKDVKVEGFPKEFSAIKARDIFNYMTAVGASDAKKAEFVSEAYRERKKKKAVDKTDELGGVIEIPVYDKDGKVKRVRRKKVMKDVPDGETQMVFNLTKAKEWFQKEYPNAVIIKGKRINESTIFSSWGTPKPTTDKTTQEEEN